MEGQTLIRTKSHRSRDRLRRVVPVEQWYFTFYGDSGLCYVPNDKLPEVLTIPGITKATRLKGELLACW